MRATDPDMALVLFSGGQDSSIALAWALRRYNSVETIGFDYGQRHAVEFAARDRIREGLAALPAFAPRLGADTVVDMNGLGAISETALTREQAIAFDTDGLPTTFVPGRNLAFLVYAGAVAWRRGARVLVGGMCEADFSGYPDCRAEALEAQMRALRLGMDADFTFEAPLMRLTKGESWGLADEIGGAALVDLINEHSHTCYLGDRGVRHDWGYGCGTCPACVLRARGWDAYRVRSRA